MIFFSEDIIWFCQGIIYLRKIYYIWERYNIFEKCIIYFWERYNMFENIHFAFIKKLAADILVSAAIDVLCFELK